MVIFDGNKYEGPVPVTGEDVPNGPGVYLICTDSAGGIKILGVYESDDMRMSIANNPKSKCWKENCDNGLSAYYLMMDAPQTKREDLCRRTIENRWYRVVCNDPPMDDF
jgi:hypothetical protein